MGKAFLPSKFCLILLVHFINQYFPLQLFEILPAFMPLCLPKPTEFSLGTHIHYHKKWTRLIHLWSLIPQEPGSWPSWNWSLLYYVSIVQPTGKLSFSCKALLLFSAGRSEGFSVQKSFGDVGCANSSHAVPTPASTECLWNSTTSLCLVCWCVSHYNVWF